MKAYDASWARGVYSTYAKLCTRAQQMDGCILETIRQTYGRTLSRESLISIIIADIQHAAGNKLWRLYKRLNKKTPLDRDLLRAVSDMVYYALEEIDVDEKQRQFEWD